MTTPLTGYECDCDFMDENPCGGCEYSARTYRDDPIHWREHEGGIHWHIECAFVESERLRGAAHESTRPEDS